MEAVITVNEGAADRIIRLIVAAAAVLAAWWASFGSVAGIILLAFAGWIFVTGVSGYCPTYVLFRFSTRPSPHRISVPGLRAAAHH